MRNNPAWNLEPAAAQKRDHQDGGGRQAGNVDQSSAQETE